MSVDCRARMEIECTEEAIRFVTGKPLKREVPQAEYDVQKQVTVMQDLSGSKLFTVPVVGGSGFLGSHVAGQLFPIVLA